MGPGDPVQKLALMMAVMMLGMPPVNGYHADVGPGEQGARGQVEPIFLPSAWIESNKGILVSRKGANPAASHGNPPVEPGGFATQRIQQRVQLGMEDLAEEQTKPWEGVRPETMRRTPGGKECNPSSGGSGQENRPRREAAQKATDALKKGADATRGRGRRRGRMYQRTGIRN
jgi:hypothetical protein